MAFVRKSCKDVHQVGNTGLCFSVVTNGIVAIRLSALNFLFNILRRIEKVDGSRLIVVGLTHLLRRFLQAHDTSSVLSQEDFGNGKYVFTVNSIKPLCQVTRNFQVLLLVITDRNKIRLVQQNVGGHQGRIGQKPGRHGVAALRSLIFVLSHAFQFTHIGHGRHNPTELYMFGNFRLNEENRFFRIQPGCQIDGCQLTCPFMKHLRVLRDRNGMLIDDAIIAFVFILHLCEITQCT